MIITNTIISQNNCDYLRPDSLSVGESYLLLERHCCSKRIEEIVQFVSYTVCPGTVIVVNSQNHRIYTARDQLFSANPIFEGPNCPV
ncbi:MAG: hypothetical protein P4L50_00980 [Anaerolineaceae bacterium]|nr:hypothetical protein [Anaerolineaceae bacterium]